MSAADRELLELAARAAGIEIDPGNVDTPIVSIITTDGYWWDPITDDGDALRLAVKLGIYVQPFTKSLRPSVFCRGMNNIGTECIEHFDEHDGDVAAATRRAIVRAAAEIGRAM